MNALERPPVAPGLSAGRPTPKEPRLPPLREDLRLHEGPDADDGSPTWVLEDPARDQFFQLGVLQAECLKRWHLGTAKTVAAAVGRETLLRPTAETVENFAKFLMRMSLTREAGTSARLAEQMKRKPKQTLWKFFLHHYLFFRIPLVAPDAFLRRTLPWVERLFFTKIFLWATLTALVLALYLIGRQWDAFTHTFSHFFSWEGAVMAGLTIACTKVIHELAHAYTAEHFGCRIPHMGIAFMVMMPLLYTDTSAAWRLKSKRQRMAVCAAGVLGELALGVWAALAWSFLPEGGLKSAAFMLATTTWIMTLAINSSPFMRFDGYYLLSDWLGVANLHQRSFALAKWRMRELLFGFGEKKPESFEPWKERALIIYAWATWLYRFFLFCGIALLVYHAFFKLLGIFLFCVEVSVFVMLPILRELKEWALLILKGKAAPRSLSLLFPVAGILAVFFMPWRSEVAAPAVVKPAAAVTLYTPAAAQVEAIEAAQGDAVKKGQVLFRLRSPQLAHELEKLESDRASLRWRAEYMRMNREGAADVPAALRELSALERRIAELKQWCDANGKKLYLLANSGCLNFCSAHQFHDNLVSHEQEIRAMDNAYNFRGICHDYLARKEKQIHYLRDTNFIRPEDLPLYEPFFDVAKLATRSSRDPVRILEAYLNGSYHGNLMDLMEPDHAEAFYPAILENSRIPAEFGEHVLNCPKNCGQCTYCEEIFSKAKVILESGGIASC